jgi:hypothetical protein
MKKGTGLKAIVAVALLLLLSATAGKAGEDLIFADGFESGNTLAWSSSAGEPPLVAADAYRFSDLDLRDPHIFINVGVCLDSTTTFNNQLQTAITTDSDGDGNLDASHLLLFRPFEEPATATRLDFAQAACSAPVAGTSCAPVPGRVPQTMSYATSLVGTCVAPVPGTTNATYTPPTLPTAPCFGSAERPVVLELSGMSIPLRGVRVGATIGVGDPPVSLTAGFLMGFLRESDANSILLPPTFPVVGGQPLAILFPGGAGNCAAGDDRDTHEAVSGWWLYMNFPAEPVEWTGM